MYASSIASNFAWTFPPNIIVTFKQIEQNDISILNLIGPGKMEMCNKYCENIHEGTIVAS